MKHQPTLREQLRAVEEQIRQTASENRHNPKLTTLGGWRALPPIKRKGKPDIQRGQNVRLPGVVLEEHPRPNRHARRALAVLERQHQRLTVAIETSRGVVRVGR